MADESKETASAVRCKFWGLRLPPARIPGLLHRRSTISEGLKALLPPTSKEVRLVKPCQAISTGHSFTALNLHALAMLVRKDALLPVTSRDQVVENNRMEYWKHMPGANTATMELAKKMLPNPAEEELFKKMLAQAAIGEDIKDMDPIKRMFKGNGGIMEEFYGINGTAAKTDAMEYRATVNPIYSLAQFDSSLLMDPNYCLKLDSGASMNVVGDYMLLKEYRHFYGASYPVTLPDGSQLQIVGVGTIKTRDFYIPDVYLVAGLRTNLISVSQLDKRHRLCCAFFNNKCEVMNTDGEIVGGAILQENGMYVLSFLEVV